MARIGRSFPARPFFGRPRRVTNVQTASVTAITISLTVQNVAAAAHVNAQVTPVIISLTIPNVGATSHETASVSIVTISLAIPNVAAGFALASLPKAVSFGGLPYALDLFDGSDVMETLLSPAISVSGWSKRINAPGKLVFKMNKHHPEATDENLRMWRNITFYRRSGSATMLPTWCGIILAKREVGDYLEVLCMGALTILSKRVINYGGSQTFTGQGSTEVFNLLSATNGDGATGISEGAGGVTATLNLTLSGADLLKTVEAIAGATGGEFEVDDQRALNFVPSLGSDKSELIELIFRRDGQQSNLSSYEIAEDGEPMANKIIGTTSAGGGLSSTYTHPTSTPDYPLLVEVKAFNQANDQGTLDALTEAYGLQRGLPIPDFKAVPATATKKFNPLTGERELAGITYEDVEVGDLVLVTVITPNRNESVVKRIAELIVDVDENLNEQLRYTLTTAGVFVTEQYLGDTEFADIKRRVQEIESQL